MDPLSSHKPVYQLVSEHLISNLERCVCCQNTNGAYLIFLWAPRQAFKSIKGTHLDLDNRK